MSKVDAQRALRDARYAQFAATKAASARPAPAPTAARKRAAPEAHLVELFAVEPAAAEQAEQVEQVESPVELPASVAVPEAAATLEASTAPEAATIPAATIPAAATAPEAEATEEATTEELCGHRSINGRSCTRDKGHPQKNHRYN
jgi:hypothetical protein